MHQKHVSNTIYSHVSRVMNSLPRTVLALALKSFVSWETHHSQTNENNLSPYKCLKIFKHSVYQGHLGHLVKIQVILLKMHLFWTEVGHVLMV